MTSTRLLTVCTLVFLSCLVKLNDSSALKSNTPLRQFCLIFALPGRENGPKISEFETQFDKYREAAGVSIFGAGTTHDQRMAEADADNCTALMQIDSYTPECAYHRITKIKDQFKEDLVKLETVVNTHLDAKYMFIVYLSTWFLDNVFLSLDCGPVALSNKKPYAVMKYLAKWSHLITNRDKFCKWPAALSSSTVVNLRETVRYNCMLRSTEPFCELKPYFEIVDTVEELCNMVPAANWGSNNADWQHFKDATNLLFFTKWTVAPQDIASLFHSDTQEEAVKELLSRIIAKMYDDFRQNDLTFAQKLMTILPNSNRLPCDFTAQFPTFPWLLCTCGNVFKDIRLFMVTYTTAVVGPRERKVLYKDISYLRTYIEQSRNAQIMVLQQQYAFSLAAVVVDIQNSLQERMQQLGEYFTTIAETETIKLQADVAFLQGKITTYGEKIDSYAEELGSNLGGLLATYMVTAVADLAYAVAKMVVQMIQAGNPLSWLLDGGNVADILTAGQDIARGARRVTEAGYAIEELPKLIEENNRVKAGLDSNQEVLTNVHYLINTTIHDPDSESQEFKDAQDAFLVQYNAYSPAVSPSDLAGLEQYWNGFIDGICDGISETEGAVAAGARAASAYRHRCQDGKELAAKIVACQVEIFDFQFELMETMAQIMISLTRIHEAKKLGEGPAETNINGITEAELTAFAAVSGISYKMQQTINLYQLCDLYEYWRGNPHPECNGMATNLDKLISASDPTCTAGYKYIDIPTKPVNASNLATDFSYVDLKKLYTGELVPFQIPNSQWLVDNAGLLESERNFRYFLDGIHIYVPVPPAEIKRRGIEVIAVPTNDGNKLNPTEVTTYVINDNVAVNGIRTNPNITFQYSENCDRATTTIRNPYEKCGVNTRPSMGDYCPDTSDHMTWRTTNRPLPSIYTKYYLQMTGFNHGLDAPVENFKIRAGIKFCSVDSQNLGDSSRRKRSRRNIFKRRQDKRSTNTCCASSTQYYKNQCTDCPTGTKAYFDNLFCGYVLKLLTKSEGYTYDEAVAACVADKTTIATAAQLAEARQLQQTGCDCAWFEGQQINTLSETGCDACPTSNIGNVYCATKYKQ